MILNIPQAVQTVIDNGGTITRQAVHKWSQEIPRPSFFSEVNGKIKVDVDNSEWLMRVNSPGLNKKRIKTSQAKKISTPKEEENNIIVIPPRIPEVPVTDEIIELEEKARIAALNDTIFASRIREEKSKQEEIKTLELKKDLAPVYLVKHFFSFSESMMRRLYNRPHEIEPQLAALFLAGESKKGTQLIIRELESIIIESQKSLIAEMESEGIKKDNE